jgi:hypothetical protein
VVVADVCGQEEAKEDKWKETSNSGQKHVVLRRQYETIVLSCAARRR